MIGIFYVLAAMWTLGCIGAVIAVTGLLWTDGSRIPAFLCLATGLPVAVVCGALPWVIAADEAGPDLATLTKDEWRCTAQHTRTSTSYIMSGKVLVPVTSTHEVCDQYGRTE
jgi:hypothetical protein